MGKKILYALGILGVLLFIAVNESFAADLVPIGKVSFTFADKDKAKVIITTDDLFLNNLSPFDMSSRVKTDQSVTKEEFKIYIGKQVLSWDDADVHRIRLLLQDVCALLKPYNMFYPGKISLIKTTGLEEGNAAYCRGDSSIIFPIQELSLENSALTRLLTHELFHIFSRNNLIVQEKLYNLIGFNKTNELQIPEKLFIRKITNPDAVMNKYYFASKINDQPIKVMPILLADSKYNTERGGEFFDYMKLYFISMAITGTKTLPLFINDRVVLLEVDDIHNYYEMIGENTDYIIHPEEVLADNFVLLVNNNKNIRTKIIIEKMKALLK